MAVVRQSVHTTKEVESLHPRGFYVLLVKITFPYSVLGNHDYSGVGSVKTPGICMLDCFFASLLPPVDMQFLVLLQKRPKRIYMHW